MDVRRLIVFALLMLFGIGMVFIRWRGGLGISYRVPTGAMSPTIPVGARVIANPWAYRSKAPQRGDMIVFSYPLDPNYTYVSRVIAVGGDTIEIRDKAVVLNGKLISEPHAVHSDVVIYPRSLSLPEPYRSRDQFGPVTVSANAFFVLGDNREHASDSRYWGTVPRNLIRARVVHIFR